MGLCQIIQDFLICACIKINHGYFRQTFQPAQSKNRLHGMCLKASGKEIRSLILHISQAAECVLIKCICLVIIYFLNISSGIDCVGKHSHHTLSSGIIAGRQTDCLIQIKRSVCTGGCGRTHCSCKYYGLLCIYCQI